MVLAQAFGEGGLLAALVSIPVGIALAIYLNARVSQARHRVFKSFAEKNLFLCSAARWPLYRSLPTRVSESWIARVSRSALRRRNTDRERAAT